MAHLKNLTPSKCQQLVHFTLIVKPLFGSCHRAGSRDSGLRWPSQSHSWAGTVAAPNTALPGPLQCPPSPGYMSRKEGSLITSCLQLPTLSWTRWQLLIFLVQSQTRTQTLCPVWPSSLTFLIRSGPLHFKHLRGVSTCMY